MAATESAVMLRARASGPASSGSPLRKAIGHRNPGDPLRRVVRRDIVASLLPIRPPYLWGSRSGISAMWYLYGFVLLAGIANAVQPGQNATLAKGFSQPLTAGLFVGIGGAFGILVVGLITRRLAWPSAAELVEIPWWAWFGGVLGGGVVVTQLLIARQIGAGAFLGLLVTAGVVTSILLDHFGWAGFDVHPATPWRILGGLLMIGGVALVAIF